MFVTEMRLEGHGVKVPTVVTPTWEEVEASILMLNQSSLERVILVENSTEDQMLISGGDGVYHVGVIRGEREFFFLRGPDDSDANVLINAPSGGDLVKKRHLCKDVEYVKRIAKRYYLTGELDATATWEREY